MTTTVIKPIETEVEFFEILIKSPNDKRIAHYLKTFQVEAQTFNDYLKAYLPTLLAPRKKFITFYNTDQIIKASLALLCSKSDKFNLAFNPTFCHTLYDSTNSMLVGCDKHILAAVDSTYYWEQKEQKELITIDKLGNLISYIDGKEFSKYPDYLQIIPTLSEEFKEFILEDQVINNIFYIAKLGKICKLEGLYIKIGACHFNVYMLSRLITFVLGVPGVNKFALNIHAENGGKIAFYHSDTVKLSYLIMPVINSSNQKCIELCDLI